MWERLKDFADDRLFDGGCAYCEEGLDETQDHVPSKAFLDKPYPGDLAVVAACEKCNSSFSSDEEYMACIIACAVAGSTDPAAIGRDKVRQTLTRQAKLRERIERSKKVIDGVTLFEPEKPRFVNVLRKLAKGHALFELSTPLRSEPETVDWWAIPAMTQAQLDDFDAAHVWGLLNEVGSRATQRMMVVQLALKGPGGEDAVVPMVVSDWVTVQEGRYRYLAIDDGGRARVKIIIGEYLAAEVVWPVDQGEAAVVTAGEDG